MPATVIVGLQWGDEGKGKTTDFLAEQVAMVVRYQGGHNAGHTVVRGDEVFKLRLTPSGVLYPHMTSVIGNGVLAIAPSDSLRVAVEQSDQGGLGNDLLASVAELATILQRPKTPTGVAHPPGGG